jgi:hypothetical protein
MRPGTCVWLSFSNLQRFLYERLCILTRISWPKPVGLARPGSIILATRYPTQPLKGGMNIQSLVFCCSGRPHRTSIQQQTTPPGGNQERQPNPPFRVVVIVCATVHQDAVCSLDCDAPIEAGGMVFDGLD